MTTHDLVYNSTTVLVVVEDAKGAASGDLFLANGERVDEPQRNVHFDYASHSLRIRPLQGNYTSDRSNKNELLSEVRVYTTDNITLDFCCWV